MNRSAFQLTPVPAIRSPLRLGKAHILLADLQSLLQVCDHVLCCGQERARATMRHNVLGVGVPQGPEGKTLTIAPALPPQKVLLERDPEDSEMGPLTQRS